MKEERQFKKTLACTLEENGIQKAIPVATKLVSTKPAGEGSGLGLDIVRKIIEKHEGKITVTSEVKRHLRCIFQSLMLQYGIALRGI